MTREHLHQEAFERHVGELTANDPRLAGLVTTYGVPAVFTRPPGFPALVLLILEQQVSLASGAAAYARVRERLGPVTADQVLATTSEQLRADGVSRQKDRYLRALAAAVRSGTLDLEELEDAPDDEARRRLTALPGIGAWTADAYLLVCLGRPDVWPVGDRALQVGAAEALGLESVPGPAELALLGDRWRPHRATAARLIWHAYLERRGRVATTPDLRP